MHGRVIRLQRCASISWAQVKKRQVEQETHKKRRWRKGKLDGPLCKLHCPCRRPAGTVEREDSPGCFRGKGRREHRSGEHTGQEWDLTTTIDSIKSTMCTIWNMSVILRSTCAASHKCTSGSCRVLWRMRGQHRTGTLPSLTTHRETLPRS
jgi:hypothetical protein